MVLLAGVAAGVVIIAVAMALAVWRRHHRDRRDLEGHFQQEWDEGRRWASLGDESAP